MSRRFNADLEGCRVLLRMSTGDVEGTVYGVPENSSRLSLIKVVIVDSGTPIAGTFHFYDRDIASCVVLDNTHRKKQVIGQDEDGPRLLRVRPLPPHLERLNASVNSCEFICHRIEGDHNSEEVVKKGLIELMGPPDTLPKLQRPLPSEFEVIDQVNDRFNKAMAAVRNARSISIGFEGPKVSRHRPISVLAVATSTKVFIFDVMNLKEELFNCGLKEVLESDDIEKVIHDCRHLSDCLYHQYKVDLNNVFDTMVADVVIYAHKKLDAGQMSYLPQFVRGVQNCLRGFLNLTQEQLKYTRSRQGQQEELVCMWDQRPLSLAQIDSLVKDTVFLAELARTCLRQLLLQFQQSVHFFLKLDRDANTQNLDCLTPHHILPASFKEVLNSGVVVPGSRRQSDNYNYDRDCYREYGRYNRNNEDNRFYHRGQQRWQEDNRFQYQSQRRWHDNGYHRRGQGRGGYAEPRGVRSQGDAVRGQCSGRVEIYGEADKVDDSLFLVAMRHHQDTYHDKEPGDANAQVSAVDNGQGSSSVRLGANRFGGSAGESSEGSEDDSPVCDIQRAEENQGTEVCANEEVAPDDMLMFVGMPTAEVQKTPMAAVGDDSLLLMGSDGGQEEF
ncbi:piRNA biogenesis protein EXD1-like [Haemaphysalis longicornis]